MLVRSFRGALSPGKQNLKPRDFGSSACGHLEGVQPSCQSRLCLMLVPPEDHSAFILGTHLRMG